MIRKAIFVVLLPVLVFVGTGWPMMHFTGRDQFRRTGEPHTVPLNFRAGGYDAADAAAYWEWLGPAGRQAERRFLAADFVFPVGYGGALLCSLLIAWSALGRPFRPAWLALPVVIAVIADWAENFLHWQQLAAFSAGAAVDARAIGHASTATSVKSVAFWVASALVLVLAGWLAIRKPRPA